jgi:hypothetical protein
MKKDDGDFLKKVKTVKTVHEICNKVFEYLEYTDTTWTIYRFMDEHVMRYCVTAVLDELHVRFPDSKVVPIHISNDKETGKTSWVENPDQLFSYTNGVLVDWSPLAG